MPFWSKNKDKKEKEALVKELEIALKQRDEAVKERDEAVARNKQLEEALSKSDQQLENVLKERDDVFASNKQLTEAFTKSVQQFEKERDDLAASKKQLEEAALKRQIQTDNQAKKRPEETIQIVIVFVLCSNILLDVKSSDTIWEIKAMIKKKKGSPQDLQHLKFNGIELRDEWTIAQCGIKGGSIISHSWF